MTDRITTWRIGADLGDAIFAMSLVAAVGGKNTIRCVDRDGVTPRFKERYPILVPLFEAQDYIEKVEWSEELTDIDITNFRRFHSSTTTLIDAQRNEANIHSGAIIAANGTLPWLKVEPDIQFDGRIIIARSPRYNNDQFPWRSIVQHYGKRLLFVGLDGEYSQFIASFGHVDRIKVKDFLELAQAIAGASLFIGNQSSPHAVALGLGVTIISEVSENQPDCIYRRSNVQYVADGSCTLPDIAGSGELKLPPNVPIPAGFNRSNVPPGDWQFPNLPPCNHFIVQQALVSRAMQCSTEEAAKLLHEHNFKRVPAFFRGGADDPLQLFKIAMANAFGSDTTPQTTKP